MNGKYNIWNKWDPLKTVMLGDTYASEFFRDIKNSEVRGALQQIADETQEDLESYSNILKEFGCNVIRPILDPNDNIMNHINADGEIASVPRSPLQPRDAQLVLGNKLFYTRHDHVGISNALDEYNLTDSVPNDKFRNFEAPSLTVVGKDLYFDRMHDLVQNQSQKQSQDLFKDEEYIKDNFRINRLTIGGHNDAQFGVLKPGALLSLNEIQNYEKTFPGWDVCYLHKQGPAAISPFSQMKANSNGMWWVPGQEDNDEFHYFVSTWLSDWVGYVEETVFDINILMLDEHHVCVSQMDNPVANAFFKKHKIEPVYVPWRHRYFWDGGLHCITLDLYREGKQVDYFPGRTECVVCEGYVP